MRGIALTILTIHYVGQIDDVRAIYNAPRSDKATQCVGAI